MHINFWSLLMRLPDDVELRVIDGSNDDKVIYDGILEGNKDKALAAIDEHIDNQEKVILQQIRIDREKKDIVI